MVGGIRDTDDPGASPNQSGWAPEQSGGVKTKTPSSSGNLE